MATKRMLTPEEQAKVRRALDLIQEGQNLIEEACQQLCPVSGFCSVWERTCKLWRAVKAQWHVVEQRRAGMTPPRPRPPLTRIPRDLLKECQEAAGITADTFTDREVARS